MRSDDIRILATSERKKYKQLRYGQAVFNAAHALSPAEANQFVGTDLDPFYHDERVEAFLTELDQIGFA